MRWVEGVVPFAVAALGDVVVAGGGAAPFFDDLLLRVGTLIEQEAAEAGT